MHYRDLDRIDINYGDEYRDTLEKLVWSSPERDMTNNIQIFVDFLKAWKSYRKPIDEEKFKELWLSEIEPYAKALESEFLEDLNFKMLINIHEYKGTLRVGVAIEHMYGALQKLPGIGETNASKLLHLRLPNLIVMTDAAVRKMCAEVSVDLFNPFNYSFLFLKFVNFEINEAIDTLCKDKHLTRTDAIDYLKKFNGKERSLAKLADEYYYAHAHGYLKQ